MSKNTVYTEYNIPLAAGVIYPLEFFPFIMQDIEIFNDGPNDAKAMINDASFANAITVVANGKRDFHSNAPNFKRVSLYSDAGTTIRVVTSR